MFCKFMELVAQCEGYVLWKFCVEGSVTSKVIGKAPARSYTY